MLNKRILVLMFVVAFLLLVGCGPPPTVPNRVPIIISDPITTATVEEAYTYDVNATDPDGDTLTYSLATPEGMTIDSASGLIKWTPTSAQVGNNLVTVMVSDGALYITQSFTIVVGTLPAVNQAPVITSIPVTTATVGLTYVYDVNATDPDGDTLTYSLTTKPSGMAINPTNGLIWWVPTSAQAGNNSVIVNVSDGALSDTQSFIIKVSEPSVPPVNQAPIVISTPITVATVGVGYVYEVKAFDPEGDTLTYSLTTKPSGMAIGSSTGKITWTPGSTGSYGVTVKVSDGVLSDTQSFTIVVSGLPAVNQAPVITPIPDLTAILGVEYTHDVEATDPDNDVLTYSLTTKPVGMSIVPSTGKITWIPNATGDYDVTVEVSDGVLSDTQSFAITVSTVEITRIEVEPETMTLFVGESRAIESVTATYEIKKGFEAPIALGDCTYLSDDEAVATVLVGVVTAVAEGSAIIYVTYAGETDTIMITVLPSIFLPVHNITEDEYYTTIQGAVDVASPSDTIEVATGIYDEAITIGIENLTLQSKTWLGAIIRPIIPQTEKQEAAIRINADGVTIDGFEIDGTTLAVNGICGWDTSGLTIKNNKIHGAVSAWDGCGILLMSWGNGGTVYNNLIENNEVYDTGRMGIMVMDYGATYSVTSGNTITGNTVYDVWKKAIDWVDHGGGIQINVAKDCAITNNEVYDVQNDMWGIYMFGSAGGNTITENTFRNNEIGIHLWISGEGGTTINWGSETPASPQVHYNNIYDNSYGAININKAGTIMVMDATYNWWGSELGPKYEGFPALGGDAVSDNVNFAHFLTSPH